jgi:glycosyltransferase involved in cell wall biosynthesis
MKVNQSKFIVITPVYEDVEASSRLFKELVFQFQNDVFVVAVDDGSLSQPLTINCLENARIDGVVLKLKRNVGHQRAIAIGLGYASENIVDERYVIVMDSDGEDIPSTISDLLQQLKADDVDVVVAQRKNRVETLRFKVFYLVYKYLFRFMTGRAISFGNFMALKPHAVRRLVAMQELSIHVASTVLASKLRTGMCPLDRGPRYAGQSKANFIFQVLHGFKALMVFAEDVLVRVGTACALIASFSLIGAVLAIILKLLGVATPGWFSVALGILVLMLLQTGGLALMTLMLTGVVRSGNNTAVMAYHEFVDQVLETSAPVTKNLTVKLI